MNTTTTHIQTIVCPCKLLNFRVHRRLTYRRLIMQQFLFVGGVVLLCVLMALPIVLNALRHRLDAEDESRRRAPLRNDSHRTHTSPARPKNVRGAASGP